MKRELAKIYEPGDIQDKIMQRWLDGGAFSAMPDERDRSRRYVIMMPLPNVTGALHMGHAMDNVMQDLLIRWHRMMGDNTLWQPGTDHAGIATQAVVEKRLLELEGKTRHDIGREALVQRIWEWKDEYQSRIIQQQQLMGCSCDWQRQRFTMDGVCSAAVRESFFRLFADRLIYRGDRLVNWDCQLQTAVSDDEVYHEAVQGHFWHLRYPIIDSQPGEPEFVVVATTRPETMLGDTAVACHPLPARALEIRIEEQRRKLAAAGDREKPAVRAELERLEERRQTHLEVLEQLVAMAQDGRKVLLPLIKREIPLILDEWAKPELGSGCVKITPAHDRNDYEVWQRHADAIGIVNILAPDGSLNANSGSYAGLDRFTAREHVVADLSEQGLIEAVEDHEIEIGHSDRSKTLIEPYLSKQWFVRMHDIRGGIVCGQGTAREFWTAGLSQASIDAVDEKWSTPGGLRLAFHPARYRGQYVSWLAEKRDWCISRQLWWGHRIPVWTAAPADHAGLKAILDALPKDAADELCVLLTDSSGEQYSPEEGQRMVARGQGPLEVQVCLRSAVADEKYSAALEAAGLMQSPDVLDTWFSSALWPFSTLGWPDPANAPIGEAQKPLGPVDGYPDAFTYYYPGSCLVTARDIISLWVARMVIMGLYIHGEVPFTDCFVHAKILDGRGVTMSKSKGNGIDPVDIIERYGVDAMRYLICDMETGNQDVRLPVQATCPACQELVELAEAGHGRTIFTYLCTACGAEFDVLGTMADIPPATIISDRFEAGRSFCNKLWNAARFTLMNLGEISFVPRSLEQLAAEDRWILSRLNKTLANVTDQLKAFRPSAALNSVRDFFWSEFCDWYLELIKPRLNAEIQAPNARRVLAVVFDQILRLLHPFVPFITETIWGFLNEQAPVRGISEPLPASQLCILARWPQPNFAWANAALEAEFEQLKAVIGRLRELRSRHDVPPRKLLPAAIKVNGRPLETLQRHIHLIIDQARLSALELGAAIDVPPNAATQILDDHEIFLGDVLDPVLERTRLERQRAKILKELEASQKKLGNPKFVTKAPPKIVEEVRHKVSELEGRLAVVNKNLSALPG